MHINQQLLPLIVCFLGTFYYSFTSVCQNDSLMLIRVSLHTVASSHMPLLFAFLFSCCSFFFFYINELFVRKKLCSWVSHMFIIYSKHTCPEQWRSADLLTSCFHLSKRVAEAVLTPDANSSLNFQKIKSGFPQVNNHNQSTSAP